jgi:transposase
MGRDVAQIDREMADRAGRDTEMAERIGILTSIPGVGLLTAITLLVDMPELGKLDGKEVAALAGLAPITQRSGTWQGAARSVAIISPEIVVHDGPSLRS